MLRIVEPELMNDKAQAEAYANADFEQADKLFINTFKLHFSCSRTKSNMLDLGCGPGNISFQFANHFPHLNITGVDGSDEMIKLANRKKAELYCQHNVSFINGMIPGNSIPKKHYGYIISNSLLHHLHQPQVLWSTIKQYASANTKILIVDLFRPPSKEVASTIVNKYASNEPDILQRDFYNSLLAAFTISEIEQQLLDAKLTELKLKIISDRHIAIYSTKTT